MKNARTIKRIAGTDIVEVRYAGEITYALRISAIEALAQLGPPGSLQRLLLNYTSAWPTTDPDPPAVAAFGDRLGRIAFLRGARIALLNAPEDVEAQAVTISEPAGLEFRRFRDRTEAIAWLGGT